MFIFMSIRYPTNSFDQKIQSHTFIFIFMFIFMSIHASCQDNINVNINFNFKYPYQYRSDWIISFSDQMMISILNWNWLKAKCRKQSKTNDSKTNHLHHSFLQHIIHPDPDPNTVCTVCWLQNELPISWIHLGAISLGSMTMPIAMKFIAYSSLLGPGMLHGTLLTFSIR